MRLPHEDELREHIRQQLATELRVTSDLLDLGTGILQGRVRPDADVDIEALELTLCLGLLRKACHQHRAVVALSEIGLGDVAESNGRMLLETALAVHFLTREVVTLKRDGKPLPDVTGYPLTRHFRAKLYLAHDAFSRLKTLSAMAEAGNHNGPDVERVLESAKEDKKAEIAGIGKEWAERLESAGTFAGVKIHHLAESLGQTFLYKTFYKPACHGVHAADALKHVDVGERSGGGLSWRVTSSPGGVAEALVFSSLMFREVLMAINERLGLGIVDQLNELTVRVHEMKQRLPED